MPLAVIPMKKRRRGMKKLLPAVFMILLLTVGTAGADIAYPGAIAAWNMSQITGNVPASAVGIGSSHVTAYDMTRGAGLTLPTATSNAINSSGWTGEATDYVQFGIKIDPGYQVTLSDLYFGTKTSGTGPTQLLVKTSLDNYASTVYTVNQDNAGGTYKNPDVNLSSLGSITGDFYIRFYGIGATSSNGTMRVSAYDPSGTYYFDSITGNVTPTPIPAAAWLFGSGLVGLVGFRRKAGK